MIKANRFAKQSMPGAHDHAHYVAMCLHQQSRTQTSERGYTGDKTDFKYITGVINGRR